MYPEVEGLFRGDVRTIKLFAKVAQPVHVPALEEIEKQSMNEFDYERESKQLAQVREIIRLMKQRGYKSRDMNEENIYLYAKVGYDQDNHELLGGKHIQVFMEELQAKDPIEALPRDLLMVSRASIMLRGLAHSLHQSRSVAKAWRPIAEKVLQDESQT